jgi:hypothetical protein
LRAAGGGEINGSFPQRFEVFAVQPILLLSQKRITGDG